MPCCCRRVKKVLYKTWVSSYLSFFYVYRAERRCWPHGVHWVDMGSFPILQSSPRVWHHHGSCDVGTGPLIAFTFLWICDVILAISLLKGPPGYMSTKLLWKRIIKIFQNDNRTEVLTMFMILDQVTQSFTALPYLNSRY